MKKKKIYEGKAKKLYTTDDDNELLQEFKDEATAFNGIKKGIIRGKGNINNQMSAFLFRYLENFHVPTHFIKEISSNSMLVRKCEMIPIEVVMRNIAAGSLLKRSNYKEGDPIAPPLLEFYLKDDAQHDPMITEEEIVNQGYATRENLLKIRRLAHKVNAVLRDFFRRRNLHLVDFKLEFGRYRDHIVLADEISPDTCRFWDMTTGEKLDKDRFRKDLGNVEEAYVEVLDRVLFQAE